MEDMAGERTRWAQVRTIVEAALLLPQGERTPFLEQTVPDQDLRREVEQMLAFDDGSLFPVTEWRGHVDGPVIDQPALNGTVVGSYRILRELGRGGMGTVYLAQRADGAYEHAVALKVLQEGLPGKDMERRFVVERQILSGLTHPGIARMLDGGMTPAGSPFLVMEYVEGRPIDQYCDEHNCDLRERLQLFLKLCEAVQAAHNQLVLHLDIKPANILVTAAGEPRLLDFGIARLMRESADGLVQPSVMLMTPRYASPEQAAGKPLGVGSDVFSLATLLYVLLTGTLPYPIAEANALEAARIIREQDPTLPSRSTPLQNAFNFRPELRGDLDNILVKGLRKEPERRYSTADALRDDILRYLDSRPVLAHKDSFGYRTGKFFRRHRPGVAAAAVMLCVIAGSVAAVEHSAIVARRDRANAERRLNDIQDLARFYVNDLFVGLSDIPGTLPMRKKMTENAVKYLQSMTDERSKDPKFSGDLSTGLYAMASIQGFPNEPNLGDLHGALNLFTLAREMNDRHAAENPADPDNLARKGLILARTSNVVNTLGDVPAALAMQQQAWDTVQPLLRGPKTRRFLQIATYCFFQAVYLDLDNQFNMADPEQALVWIDRAEDLLEQLAQSSQAFHDSPLLQSQLANDRLVKGDILRALGRNDEARKIFEQAMAGIDNQDGKDSVEIAKHKRDVHSEYAEFLLAQGEVAHAVQVAAPLRPKRTAAVDGPEINFDKTDYAADAEFWAILAMAQGHTQEALENIAESLRVAGLVTKAVPEDQTSVAQYVRKLVRFGTLAGVPSASAQDMLQQAVSLTAQYTARYPAVLSSQILEARAHIGLARLSQQSGDRAKQQAELAKANRLLQALTTQRPHLPEIQELTRAAQKLSQP